MAKEEAQPTSTTDDFPTEPKIPVERVQTGVRMEKSMIKVLKAIAEYSDRSFGELLEDIVLHSL